MGIGDFKNDLAIRIGAIFNGAGAFKNAANAVTKLDKSVKFLAKSYAGLYVVQKAVAFGKSSLTEYGKNQAAVQKLTREVTNLGQAFELTSINNYLDSLEKTFAVQKEQLRPAFQELMRVTKSYAVSQRLLKTGLDVSAGSGQSLTTVVNDLNQAYVGNLKGLKKYNLGLTNAELATMSFEEVTALLAKTFKGQAAVAADSFAGKMAALTIASDNAKETIGKGLVTALQSIVGEDKGIKDATNAIDNMASSISLAITEMGKLIGKFSDPTISSLLEAKSRARTGNKSNPIFDFLYGKANTVYDPRSGNMPDMSATGLKNIKERQRLEKESLARAKQLAAFNKKAAAQEKAKLLLLKAQKLLETSSKIFDIDLIQNAAALMGKISDDEALRLKLQQAILLENEDAAAKLAQQLLSSQIAAVKLGATNPVDGWMKFLSDALAGLLQLRKELAELGAAKVAIPIIAPTTTMPSSVASTGTGAPFTSIGAEGQTVYTPFDTGTSKQTVNVNLNLNPDAAKLFITDVIVGNSANGNSNQLTRVTTPWQT